MSVSFGMLGILLMLDICFIVNYFVIRALRHWANVKQEKKQERREKKSTASQLPDQVSDVAFAWLLHSVKLEPMSVKRFPSYKPIPHKLGIWSTTIFVVLSALLLSPDLVMEQLGITGIQLDTDFCVDERQETGVVELQDDLLNQTNLRQARQQFELVVSLQDALLNDTTLYGVPPYQCPPRGGKPGDKQNWDTTHENSVPFFPNYCEEALESAIEAAQHRECISEICECPTLPNSTVFAMAGLANQKICAAEVCIEVPSVCPAHSKDEHHRDNQELLEDYRYQQLKAAEERRKNMTKFSQQYQEELPENLRSTATKTADKIMHQVNVASYIYIAYSCLSLFFPSPLVLFRMPYWVGFKRLVFGVQKPYFIALAVAIWWGVEYFNNVWHSPDLWLFVQNLRLGDPCFVDADYLMARQSALEGVCEDLLPMERAFAASVWTINDVAREIAFFADSCQCFFPNYYTSQLPSTTYWMANSIADAMGFNHTLEVCNAPNECETLFLPDENAPYLGNSSICTNYTEARRLVWESSFTDDVHAKSSGWWYEIWIASGFLATLLIKVAVANFGLALMELADPFVVCAGEFLWMPTSFAAKSRNSQSENTRVPVSVRSFETFDDQGRALPLEMVQAWFHTKQQALYHAALSRAIVWGFLVHLCMINLFRTVYQDIYSDFGPVDMMADDDVIPSLYDMLEERDLTVLAACLGVAGAVIILGVYYIHRLYQLASVAQQQQGDTDISSSDSD